MVLQHLIHVGRVAQRLGRLENWPAKVRLMQENWIGQSRGLEMTFPLTTPQDGHEGITVYTTRPDTLVGASFIGLAANHPLTQSLAAQNPALAAFCAECKKMDTTEAAMEKAEKKGFDTGITVQNPLGGAPLPVWVANFVMMDYGTGAIFACPAHDQRDLDFARKYDLPVIDTFFALDDATPVTDVAFVPPKPKQFAGSTNLPACKRLRGKKRLMPRSIGQRRRGLASAKRSIVCAIGA